MRGGDDVGSRMRVAAAACLLSSGLLVAGACGAVALAEPDSSGDGGGTGPTGRPSGESTGQPGRSAPRGVGTVTRAGQGSPGQRSAAAPAGTVDSPVPPADAGEVDPSKLPEAGTEVGEAAPGDTPGEQDADPSAVDAVLEDDVLKEDEEDEDDEECGWGWWPLPPERVSSAPNGGDGYGGGAPSTTQPAAGPPAAPSLPESPVLPIALEPPVALEPLPVLVPVVVAPGVGGGGAGAAPQAPAPEIAARPPAPSRTPPVERPAAPRTDAVLPASYRAGYGEYLRTAGMPEVIAVAVPGATGIMLLTGVGGLIGYRQARAGHAIRARGSARFSS